MKLRIVILFLAVSYLSIGYSQISIEGFPLSYSHSDLINDAGVMTFNLETPNTSELLAADNNESRSDAVWRDAVAVSVNAGINTPGVGTWTDLGDNDSVWKLRLKANGAKSLEINFDQFDLPEGVRLYVYNMDRTEHIGGYTNENNKEFNRLSTHMIQGGDCIIELYAPQFSTDEINLHIKDVTYRYRDLLRLNDGGGSQVCEIDVNCAEGTAWSNMKKSTVRIRIRSGNDFYWSTGTLVNNTASDCKPYILTSYRTIINPYTSLSSTSEDFQYFRFYFGYERSECGEGTGMDYSISGAFSRANSNDNGGEEGSDFLLLELSEDIPMDYSPYWSGWNALTNPDVSSGVCLHHPMGDVKKISSFNSMPISADYGVADTHWKVTWDNSISGKGVTEIGSNGAPLFDEEGRLFGTLTTGGSSCEEVLPGGSNNPDYFGKMSKHWLENPNPIAHKLKYWLDPTSTGSLVFDGSLNPCLVGINDVLENNSVNMWPNPAIDEINIEAKTIIDKVTMFNMTGRIVYQEKHTKKESVTIDISFLPSSIYYIQCSVSDQNYSPIKLVISR